MAYRIRPNVLGMTPYSPGKPIEEVQRELGLSHVIKMASNENPLGPSPKAVAALKQAAESLNLYPDAAAFSLREAISRKFGVDESHILLGNGSDELIGLLGQIFLTPGAEVVMGDPSFIRYDAAAQLTDSTLIKVPLDADLVHDLDAMADRFTERTRIVFVANPNNPTGTIVRRDAVDRLLERLPEGAILILDEAYIEFAQHEPGFPDGLDYVRAGKPVVALRTFSKAYGLAGIRVGYGFAAPEIVDAVHRARPPFNVNSLAQVAAIAALDDDEFIARTLEANRRGAEQIIDAFRAVGAKPTPTYANFVVGDLGVPAKPIFEALLRQGVIVRSGHVLGLPTSLRVSIGTELENEEFARALASAMKQEVSS